MLLHCLTKKSIWDLGLWAWVGGESRKKYESTFRQGSWASEEWRKKEKKNEKEKSTSGLGWREGSVEGVGRSSAGEISEVEEERKI